MHVSMALTDLLWTIEVVESQPDHEKSEARQTGLISSRVGIERVVI